jgi:malto-oligosyltrehalose trehalohydrolase
MLHHLPDSAAPLATQRFNEMKFGTQITAGGTRFRLWAPRSKRVSLKLEGEAAPRPMPALPRGWFELEVEGVGHGALYHFVLEDGLEVPDPASRFQPHDVMGPSEVIDPRRYGWGDVGWAGRPWEEAVIYELHLGTFTPEGTYAAAAERLGYLADLGVTVLELLPVNDFPGRWNWGYDGALPFAPDAAYGRPEDLKALIDAAHAHGLMVVLDVVYNHFGPKGNYLAQYAPVFTDRHQTPWGEAINFDGVDSPMVRDFVLANARYWLNEYHFDGLRLDAVHEMKDEGYNHMLHDLALQVRGSTDGRLTYLILENEENDPEWLKRTGDLVPGLYDAQWNDDIHHTLDIALYGEASSYARDYANRPDWLGKALATGFAFQGEPVPTRDGRPKGAPSAELPPVAFVSFIQNHDQVGNRLFGERIAALAEPRRARIAAAIYLLAPQIPMLFMGEEWGSRTPFLYFTDVDPELGEPIRKQRLAHFGPFVAPENRGKEPPDPIAESTFLASKLDWSDLEKPEHAEWLNLYRELLAVRRKHIAPLLFGVGGHYGTHQQIGVHGTRVRWGLRDGAFLTMAANLSDQPVAGMEPLGGEVIWREGEVESGRLMPWSVVFSLGEGGATGR